MHPKDAAIEACKRIRANTVEKRLLDRRGNPNFDVTFYVLDAKGRHAGVSLLWGAKYAVCTANGPETLVCEALIEPKRAG
jgi:N4-(beta-N-acetylglucosaminyl)-L-asparaginase